MFASCHPAILLKQIQKAQQLQNITAVDIQSIKYFWPKFDTQSNGTILVHQIDDLIYQMGYKVTKQQRSIIQGMARQKKAVNIPFSNCLQIINEYKNTMNIVYFLSVNTWIALGGCIQGTGFINRDDILNILKDQFELISGIEQWLQRVVEQDKQISYTSFKKLLDNTNQQQKFILSSRFSTSQNKINLNHNLQQFQKWLAKFEK